MVRYADYDFYRGKYCGCFWDEDFYEQIEKASAYVQRITFGRSDRPDLEADTQEAVKLAACAVCDVRIIMKKKMDENGGKEITSENNDGYSVSYTVEQQGELQETILERKCYAAAQEYLILSGLLSWEV